MFPTSRWQVHGKNVFGVSWRFPLGEHRLVVWQAGHARPALLGGRPHDAEDAEQLVNLRVAGEQRLPRDHLRKDASKTPGVHTRGVKLGSEQNLRGFVPQRPKFVGVRSNWKPERSGKTKICQFDTSMSIN